MPACPRLPLDELHIVLAYRRSDPKQTSPVCTCLCSCSAVYYCIFALCHATQTPNPSRAVNSISPIRRLPRSEVRPVREFGELSTISPGLA
jgi:hypothetical protein